MEAPERGQVAHVLPRSTLGCGDSVRPAGVRMGRHPRLSPPPVPMTRVTGAAGSLGAAGAPPPWRR